MLLPSGFVAYGRPQVDRLAVGQHASSGADEDAEAGLFQYVHVVVVGVAHRPAGRVPLRLLAARRIHQPTVPVRPFLEPVEFVDLPISAAFIISYRIIPYISKIACQIISYYVMSYHIISYYYIILRVLALCALTNEYVVSTLHLTTYLLVLWL